MISCSETQRKADGYKAEEGFRCSDCMVHTIPIEIRIQRNRDRVFKSRYQDVWLGSPKINYQRQSPRGEPRGSERVTFTMKYSDSLQLLRLLANR